MTVQPALVSYCSTVVSLLVDVQPAMPADKVRAKSRVRILVKCEVCAGWSQKSCKGARSCGPGGVLPRRARRKMPR